MDAFALLALMTKAKQVFETDDTFLSFPALSPPSYSPDQLSFADPAQTTAQDLAEMVEFARLTNVMPAGVIAPTSTDEYLWDVYDEVLRTKRLASGVMTAEEQARYDAAMSFLYTQTTDGLRQDGEALRTYRQIRDAHIRASEEYRNRQLTAQMSEDPAVAAQWAQDEPQLRQALAELERRWAGEGRRAEVEAAQQVEESAAARAPSRVWTEWETSFMAAIDTTTGTDTVTSAMTSFSPYDVFDDAIWPSFTLTRAEMTQLGAQAPPELAAIFGGSDSADIEKVSFEYRSVNLNRPWLRPALFRSRFWRLGPEGGELCDGGSPPKGRCPSYVAALVFARNVVVERRAGSGSESSPQPVGQLVKLPANLFTRLDPVLLRPRPVLADPLVVRAEAAAVAPAALRAQPVALVRPTLQAQLAAQAFRATPTATVRDHRTTVRDHRTVVRDHRTRIRDHRTERPPTPVPTPPPPPPPPPPEVTNDITILAYICKRLPRCPDPDPSLTWS